jgi:glutamine synthetase
MGYEVLIGVEIEFMVFEKDRITPIESNIDCNLHSLVSVIDDFEELYTHMRNHGIAIEAIHKECGEG